MSTDVGKDRPGWEVDLVWSCNEADLSGCSGASTSAGPSLAFIRRAYVWHGAMLAFWHAGSTLCMGAEVTCSHSEKFPLE